MMIVNVKNGDGEFICRPLVETLKKSCGDGHIVDETVSTGEGGSCVVTRGAAQSEHTDLGPTGARNYRQFSSSGQCDTDRGNCGLIGHLRDGTTEVEAVVACFGNGTQCIDLALAKSR